MTFVEKCVEHIHAKSFLFCKVKLLPYLAELHVKIVKFFAPSPLIYFIQPHFGPFSFYISQVFSAEFSIHFYLLNPISSFFLHSVCHFLLLLCRELPTIHPTMFFTALEGIDGYVSSLYMYVL